MMRRQRRERDLVEWEVFKSHFREKDKREQGGGDGEIDGEIKEEGEVRFKSAEVLKSSNFLLKRQFLHHSDWKNKKTKRVSSTADWDVCLGSQVLHLTSFILHLTGEKHIFVSVNVSPSKTLNWSMLQSSAHCQHQLTQTGTDWPRLVQTEQTHFVHVLTSSDVSELVLNVETT